MKAFYTSSTQHLAVQLPFEYGKVLISHFSDGEILVKIEENVENQTVWVIAATPTPANNFFELFFLLDALNRAHAKINLLITYFGYARQDKLESNTARGAQLISTIIKQFKTNKIIVVHPHSKLLHEFLTFESVIPYDLFEPIAHNFDVIVAPDSGAKELAEHIGNLCKKSTASLEKIRTGKDQVKIINLDGTVSDKRVLIVDDLIDTGGTIIKASEILKEHGAKEIYVMATHAIFAGNFLEAIEESNIQKVYVTNSLHQKYINKKIEVLNLAPVIKKMI
ncbi:MAG TPA: ribose-phosphate diphosphokinase [Candidatus Babeliales bacterium]|nr:ribose-phosphate diphosphokinase [Candidatus Babeliales bacterium]